MQKTLIFEHYLKCYLKVLSNFEAIETLFVMVKVYIGLCSKI